MPRAEPLTHAREKTPGATLAAYVVLPHLALACVMASRVPSVVKKTASLLLICVALYATAICGTGDPVEDYVLGSVVFSNLILSIILFVWFTDPLKDIRYVKYPELLTSGPFYSRVWGATCLILNPRLVGTNAQVPHVPPTRRETRARFILRRLGRLLLFTAFVDVTESLIYFYRYLPVQINGAMPLTLKDYLLRGVVAGVWILNTYCSLTRTHIMLSLIAVATGLGNPEDWPADFFGRWSDAYTIRNAWGRSWHKFYYRYFACAGQLATRLLCVPRNTWLYTQVQMHAAFAVSALLHVVGDLALNPAGLGRSAPFFLLNAFAITLEDIAGAILRRTGVPSPAESRVVRVLGYAWVTLWIGSTLPMYLAWLYGENEFGGYLALSYSPFRTYVVPYM
ncbi:hypothetical protein BD413DRAFT_564026 [Trametes elegans]|nr:hypothetical protein BD413DRAFT_564026 [Trametes elegans]